jgi:hypothetical protein
VGGSGSSSSRSNRIVSRTSSWTRRSSLKARPIVRPISGSRFGPTTIKATIRMIMSSIGLMPNMRLRTVGMSRMTSFR